MTLVTWTRHHLILIYLLITEEKNGILIAFSLVDRESFEDIDKWLKEISYNANRNVVVGLVGCKSDLKDQIQVSHKEAKVIIIIILIEENNLFL